MRRVYGNTVAISGLYHQIIGFRHHRGITHNGLIQISHIAGKDNLFSTSPSFIQTSIQAEPSR